jgi:hypothetical protein
MDGISLRYATGAGHRSLPPECGKRMDFKPDEDLDLRTGRKWRDSE